MFSRLWKQRASNSSGRRRTDPEFEFVPHEHLTTKVAPKSKKRLRGNRRRAAQSHENGGSAGQPRARARGQTAQRHSVCFAVYVSASDVLVPQCSPHNQG